MISIDLHTHTSHGHGANSVMEMFMAGQSNGLKIHGFSEHSARPLGYDYTNEYRTHLEKMYATYIKEVKELTKLYPALQKKSFKNSKDEPTQVLFALELDWLENEIPFMQNCAKAHDFDYIVAGIHFLGTWGFDDQKSHWDTLSEDEKNSFYTAYYQTMIKMAETKLDNKNMFHILAHPDLIKIFSVDSFHKWLTHNLKLVENALIAVKNAGMAMEISSAGLRKPCAEIYPCRPIMEIAQKIQIPITFASDGHCVNTIAYKFNELEEYAREYGFKESVYFIQKNMHTRTF